MEKKSKIQKISKGTVHNVPADLKKEILDNAHIEHFVKQDNINIVEYNVDDHYITIMLHKQNKLNEIILKSLKE